MVFPHLSRFPGIRTRFPRNSVTSCSSLLIHSGHSPQGRRLGSWAGWAGDVRVPLPRRNKKGTKSRRVYLEILYLMLKDLIQFTSTFLMRYYYKSHFSVYEFIRKVRVKALASNLHNSMTEMANTTKLPPPHCPLPTVPCRTERRGHGPTGPPCPRARRRAADG